MSRHLVICLPEEGLSINNYQHPTSASSHRNRGNKELFKQSNCSVLQGTKVSSAEEHNQHIPIPQRVSQQDSTLSPSKAVINLKEVGYPPADLNIPQHNIRIFLTSIPDSLNLRLFPGGLPNIQWSHFPNIVQNLPRRVQTRFPQESLKPSPQQ